MIKADNTQKRCFVACDEQTRKDGRCSCLTNTHQTLQLQQPDVMQSVLKASDLRIGNLVYSKETNRFQKITGLTDVNPFIDAINFDYTNYNEIEPIIINEEWLLKFGFDKSIENFDYFERVKYFKYELKVGFGNITFRISEYNIIKGSTHPNIKYVHQLQNLYFALTGSELTVA